MSHIEQKLEINTESQLTHSNLQQPNQEAIDPREKELADWLEKLTSLQRINLVMLILTFALLTLHTFVDIFFNL